MLLITKKEEEYLAVCHCYKILTNFPDQISNILFRNNKII